MDHQSPHRTHGFIESSRMASNSSKTETADPVWVRVLLIGVTVAFMFVLLILPLGVIFWECFVRAGMSMSRHSPTAMP